jgi:hypothetical protein
MTKKELNIYAQCAEAILSIDDDIDRQTVMNLIKGHITYLKSLGKLVEGLSVTIPNSAIKKKSIALWSNDELTQYVVHNFYVQDYLDAHFEDDDDDDEDDAN